MTCGVALGWRRWIVAVLALLVPWLVATHARADDPPAIGAYVTDLAGVLTTEQKAAIAKRMREHHAAGGVQSAVLLVRTTKDVPIEDYAHRVATAWGGGKKDDDRGVLVVLAIDDRRSRIEVGYGLESKLTDAEARGILDGARPLLRERKYGEAVGRIVDEIVAETGGARLATKVPPTPSAVADEGGPSNGLPAPRAPSPVEERPAPPDPPLPGTWQYRHAGLVAALTLLAEAVALGWMLKVRRKRRVASASGETAESGVVWGERLAAGLVVAVPGALLALYPESHALPMSCFVLAGVAVALTVRGYEGDMDPARARLARWAVPLEVTCLAVLVAVVLDFNGPPASRVLSVAGLVSTFVFPALCWRTMRPLPKFDFTFSSDGLSSFSSSSWSSSNSTFGSSSSGSMFGSSSSGSMFGSSSSGSMFGSSSSGSSSSNFGGGGGFGGGGASSDW